jgi:hypothetical protein
LEKTLNIISFVKGNRHNLNTLSLAYSDH